MRVSQHAVTIIFSQEGRAALELAAVDPSESYYYVQDTDDMGLWIRVQREDGQHLLLVRWEYDLSLDLPLGETRTVGLRP